MPRIEDTLRANGQYWTVTVSGEPLGCTWNGDSYSHKMTDEPSTLPTRESAERVSRAFGRWIKQRFPGKEEPRGQYFVAFPEGPCKVFQSRSISSEEWRRRNGNCFKSQTEAHIASDALAWLIREERKKHEAA